MRYATRSNASGGGSFEGDIASTKVASRRMDVSVLLFVESWLLDVDSSVVVGLRLVKKPIHGFMHTTALLGTAGSILIGIYERAKGKA